VAGKPSSQRGDVMGTGSRSLENLATAAVGISSKCTSRTESENAINEKVGTILNPQRARGAASPLRLKTSPWTAFRGKCNLPGLTLIFLVPILTGAHGAEKWPECFNERCASLCDYCVASLGKTTGNTSPYADLAVLATGKAIEGSGIKYAIEKMNSRKDCADLNFRPCSRFSTATRAARWSILR